MPKWGGPTGAGYGGNPPGGHWGGPDWPYWGGPLPSNAYGTIVKMISRMPSTLVIITLDYCTRTFGTSPCLATGTKCYNTFPTCKYLSAYNKTTKDYKFTLREKPLPFPGPRPYLKSEQYLSTEILPDEAVTIDHRVTLEFYDEPDSDVGIDPYVSDRSTVQGTFWRKLKARNSNYKGRYVKIKKGFIYTGFTENDYVEYFLGVIDNIEIAGGIAKVIVKGLLQVTNDEYPKTCDGTIKAAITSGSASFIAIEKKSSTTQYSATGYVSVESDSGVPEIIYYGSRSYDSATGETTFSTLTRGQYTSLGWQSATAHAIDKKIQQVIVYDNQNIVDVAKSILNAVGISDTYIDTTQFTSEKNTWLAWANVTRILHKPQKAKQYLKEIKEQFLVSIWQGEDMKIKIKYLGPNVPGQTYYTINDTANIIHQSVSVDDNEASRVTRVIFYHSQLPDTGGSEKDDFGGVVVQVDADAEDPKSYNEEKERVIWGTWIQGNTLSGLLGAKILQRFRDGMKIIPFDLELKDASGSTTSDHLRVGDVFELTTESLQGIDGVAETKLFQVTKKEQKSQGRFALKAIDAKIGYGRWGFIAPAGYPNYGSATTAQKEYAFIADSAGKMSDGTDGYKIW